VSAVDTDTLVKVTQAALKEVAVPDKAGPMAAYMKTDMLFYGVQKARRTPILGMLKNEYPPNDADEYEEAVLALWLLPHREEKYLAIGYARAFGHRIGPGSMGLYERLIVEGAWWDFVDEIASNLVGRVLLNETSEVEPTIRSWILHDDLWLRRTSIICQLKRKDDTDTQLLDDACTANLADTDFFIRKAIGWALREYAKTNPEWVLAFVAAHQGTLSALSHREATKHL
jgi:3-methyladenine DNA glycosylase AlkD